jgi:MoaA/NifB/PqqE/SkfB family radical SAM enzyme
MTRRCVLAGARGCDNGLRAKRDSLPRSERGFQRGCDAAPPLLTQDDGGIPRCSPARYNPPVPVYAIDEVAAEATRFREAYEKLEGFRPLYVKIKLLYGCNLRCQMCNHWREARPRQLTTARLKEILTELQALGCRKVHFTGGEPTLRPDLEELVAHASAAGLRVTLTTNGTLITRERARRIVEAGLRGVNVSIDSPVPAVHDEIRGVAGAFAESLEGLKNLRKESRHGKLGLALNTVVTRLNWHTLAELPKLALKVGASAIRLMGVDDHTGLFLRPSPEQIAAYNRDVAPLLAKRARGAGLITDDEDLYPFGRTPEQAERGGRGEYALGYYRDRPCFAPFTHALLDHEGRVFVCCMARGEPVLGDVTERPFREAWEGEAYRRVRLAMRTETKLPPCHRCDDFLTENRRLLRILES